MTCRSLPLILSVLLPAAFAQGDALTIAIPELPAGKSFIFSYEGQVADPFTAPGALNLSQQMFVDADGPIAAQSDLISTRLDNPPVLDLNGSETGTAYATAFVQADGAVNLTAPDAIIEERAVAMIESLEVVLSPMPDGIDEILDADVTGTGISKSYDPAMGVLTLTGSDTLANYEQVLRTITYDNTATTADDADRTATFIIIDDFSTSAAAVTTFTVEPDISSVLDWSTY